MRDAPNLSSVPNCTRVLWHDIRHFGTDEAAVAVSMVEMFDKRLIRNSTRFFPDATHVAAVVEWEAAMGKEKEEGREEGGWGGWRREGAVDRGGRREEKGRGVSGGRSRRGCIFAVHPKDSCSSVVDFPRSQ